MRVNQEINSGIGVLLGAFELAPRPSHKGVLSDAANP
jgi:hypothetical protein